MARNTLYFMRFIWKADRKFFFWWVLEIIVLFPFMFVNLLFTKLIIDCVTQQRPIEYLFGIIAVFVITVCITTQLLSYMSIKRAQTMAMRTEKHLNGVLLDKMKSLDMAYFDAPGSYDMLLKAVAEADTRANFFYNDVQNLFSCSANIITSVAIILALDPFFVAITVVVAAAVYLIERRLVKREYEYNEAVTPVARKSDYFKGLFFQRETVSDIKQYFPLASLFYRKYDTALAEKHRLASEMNNRRYKTSNLRTWITNLANYAAPYLYAGYSMYAGKITFGDMFALINSFSSLTNSMNNLSRAITQLKQQSMYINYLREVLEYEPKIEIAGGLEVGEIETIEFDEVRFRYPNTDAYALDGVSFTVTRGQKAALVGVNGAGKTTVVKLLMRFYDPESGSVRINGRDLREYSVQSLRDRITSVFQEFQAYSLTIAELVSCAEDGDMARVRDVLERVGLYGKVAEHPDGVNAEYSKFFDEDGIVFSGGQVQKLVIARMLYKGSGVLVMDEPSSALDPESEYEINRDITQAARGKTVLMISHRLSTTKDADNIILIEDGIVREQGSHDALMEYGGRYARLFTVQASEYAVAQTVAVCAIEK